MARSRDEAAHLRERLLRKYPKPCAVPSCKEVARRVGKYCLVHERNAARHGGPLQRAIRLTELRPYLATVNRFMVGNSGHPALTLVYESLSRIVSESSALRITRRPKPREWRPRLTLELQRLLAGGVTGREVFRRVAALWLLARYQPRTLPPNSKEFWAQSARMTLNLRQRNPRSRLHAPFQGSRLPPKVLATLGRTLVQKTHLVLTAMVCAIEAEQSEPQAQRARINEALASHPFSTPTIVNKEHQTNA